MNNATTGKCAGCAGCSHTTPAASPDTRLSSLADLGLNILSPLEQVHIMGGGSLTVDQKAQQTANPVQVQIDDCAHGLYII